MSEPISQDQADRIITLLERIAPVVDKIEAMAPLVEALGDMVVFRKNAVDESIGLNKQTLSRSQKTFEEVGARRVYVDLKTVSVYNTNKKKKSRR